MTLRDPEIDELGLWKPKSGYFQHYYRKQRARMTLQADPAANNAKLAFCTYHNSAYLTCDEIPNSPCCSTEPLLTYDLEMIQAAAGVVSALLDALDASSPEELVAFINGLAGLARDRVAGAASEPSQAPSTASDTGTSESEQVGQLPAPDASVDGSDSPSAVALPKGTPDAGVGNGGSPAPKPRRASGGTKAKPEPAAVAS